MKNLKSKVEYILERFEYSRNDDEYLIVKLWKEWYNLENKLPINDIQQFFSIIKELPKPTDIVRWRQKIQSEKRYLPTEPKILEKRRGLENKYRSELGYSVNSFNQT